MSDEPKFYTTSDSNIASLIWFTNCGEDTFVRVDIDAQGKPQIVFRDDLRGNPCADLAKLYHSGCQLTSVKEFCLCINQVNYEIRKAYRAAKK